MYLAPPYTFQRPNDTTAYTAGDLVANSTTPGLVIPMQWGMERYNGEGRITGVRFHSKSATVLAATFNVHFFWRAPVVTNGDNGAIAVSTAEFYLDKILCDLSTGAFLSATEKTKRIPIAGVGICFDLPPQGPGASLGGAGGFLYGLIEATGGYVPLANEVFSITPEIEVNP